MLSSEETRNKELEYIAKTQKIPYYPVSFVRGKDALLYDAEGNEYIDFLSSASTANTGHGNERIAKAVYNQMTDLTQYTISYFYTKAPVLLAEKLVEVTGIEDGKVLFSATGSASIDAAIKLARGYTGKSKIISMFESYHGSTYGAISVSALSINMRKKIGPLLPDVYHASYPSDTKSAQECLDELHYAFDHYIPADEVAAIIIEPIAGDAGLEIPPIEWIEGLRDICDEHGILLISDEIQMGLCRAGQWLCMENYGVEADLYVLGKSLGGGLPLGAVIGHRDILDCLDAPAHAFTLAGNTTVAAAALENIKILEEMNAEKISKEKGEYLKRKFEELREKYPDTIGEIKQLGLSIGVDILKDGKKDPDTTAKICYRSITQGLVLIFVARCTLRVQPPLTITYEQMDRAIDIIDEAIQYTLDGNLGDEIYEVMGGW